MNCIACGKPIYGSLCDACHERIGEFDTLVTQAEKAVQWLNEDGSPCDGFRFREEQKALRDLVEIFRRHGR